jgi:hypothetical protein
MSISEEPGRRSIAKLLSKDEATEFGNHRINRSYVNMVLKGKRPVGGSIARALGLRKVYIAE